MAEIGIVVIGRNEGERLKRCFASLAPLGLPSVYVDSGSTDNSLEIASRAGASVVELDLAIPFTAARARNEGAAALVIANPGVELLQFVDGDCEVAPDWINTARAFLAAHSDVAVVCGRRRERFPDASFYNRSFDEEWATPVGEASACGGDSLIKRDAFNSVGGFDPVMIAGEEPEMCARLRANGWRIWRLDAEMTIHDAAMYRFSQWWRRSVRSGFSYAQVWITTRRGKYPLYGRQLGRAIGWGLALPIMAVAFLMIAWPIALLVLLLLPAQVVRLAMGRGGGANGWRYGALNTVSKFAEAQGVLRFWRRRLAGHSGGAIFYK